MRTQTITPCLWFDDQAEAAVAFYTGMFKNSRIVSVTRYGEAGQEIHGKAAGSVMTIVYTGRSFSFPHQDAHPPVVERQERTRAGVN